MDIEIERLQDLARKVIKQELKKELVETDNISEERKNEIKEIYVLIADIKHNNRTTRLEEQLLREKNIAKKVIKKFKEFTKYKGVRIRIGYPSITDYQKGYIKFRLTCNNLYYNDYMKPDFIKFITKHKNLITMSLDLYKIRDCSLSRHIIIDINTGIITYYIIRSISDYNVTEVATPDKMTFRLIL